MESIKRAVIDANVLIHGRGQLPVEKVFLPKKVKDELLSENVRMKMHKLDLEVREPGEKSLEKVKAQSQEIESPTSGEDEEALALALGQKIPLVTDDKALQNLALHLGVDFRGFNTEGIKEKREWKKVCNNCGAEASSRCQRCGSQDLARRRDQHS